MGANNPFSFVGKAKGKRPARPPYFRERNDLTLGRNGKIILSSHPKKRLVNAAAADGKEEEAKYGDGRARTRAMRNGRCHDARSVAAAATLRGEHIST